MVTRTDGPFDYWKVTGDAIRAAGEKPGSDAAVIQSLAGELEGDEKNAAAAIEGDVEAGVKANTTAARTTAQSLAAKGQYAVGLLNQFAGFVDQFDNTVNQINIDYNTRYRSTIFGLQHQPEYKTGEEKIDYKGIAAGIEADLKGRYAQAEATIDDAADGIASKFKQGPTDENVRELIRAGLIPLTSAGLWPGLALTPEDKYHYYRSRMDAGLMPDFAHMTEEQRTAFIDENPGLLESWLQIKDPGQGLQLDIIALALPHVDSDDAKGDVAKILGVLGDDADVSPADFLNAFHNVSGINEGLALLAPWAAKNGVDLAHNTTVGNAQSYLKEFVAGTYSKKDDILDYINANEHEWKTGETRDYPYSPYGGLSGSYDVTDKVGGFTDSWKDMLQEDYANAILNTSQEDFGGSWESLPEDLRHDADQLPQSTWSNGAFPTELLDDNDDFKDLARLLAHGDAVPGDDLAKHIASTAVTSTSITDQYWDRQPGDDHNWDDDLASDVLDVVSRNHEATSDLVSGKGDLPPNYYGTSFNEDEPLGMVRTTNFNATLFGHDWKGDDEGQVAHMYDWIHDSHVAGGHEQYLADRAFNGLAKSISETDGDVFKNLMGSHDDGKGDSAAQNNRLLAIAITNGLADHLSEFASEDDAAGLTKADQVRLMTLLMSDHDTGDHQSTAFRLSTLVTAHEQDRIRAFINDPGSMGARELAGANARLSAMLDAASENEATERHANLQDAENDHIRDMKIASGIVATLAGKIPIAGDIVGAPAGVANTLVSNLLTPASLPAPPPNLPDDWAPTGSHVRTANSLVMIDALVQSHAIPASDVPSSLRYPYTADSDKLADDASALLDSYFKQHVPPGSSPDSPFYSTFVNEIGDQYDSYHDFYSIPKSSKPGDDIGPFLTDGGWKEHE